MTTNQQQSTPISTGYVEMWNTKWADFAIVVKTGEELKCHKVLLAKASPYIETLLSIQDTETNKIEANDFTLKTVSTFLDYIYAGLERVPKHALHKKQIDKAEPTYLGEGGCYTRTLSVRDWEP